MNALALDSPNILGRSFGFDTPNASASLLRLAVASSAGAEVDACSCACAGGSAALFATFFEKMLAALLRGIDLIRSAADCFGANVPQLGADLDEPAPRVGNASPPRGPSGTGTGATQFPDPLLLIEAPGSSGKSLPLFSM